ncbi:MAG: RNA polymerase sigma factor RpoD/SigA [Omnitrophica WOR_2 bacterium]
MNDTRNQNDVVRLLIDHGQRKGYITQNDIQALIPDTEYDDNVFDNVMNEVTEAGIPFIQESDTSVPAESPEISVAENTEVETPEIIPGADLEELGTEDMVRLYISEASQVPLLNAEQEVDLAKKIEQCRLAQEEIKKGNSNQEERKKLIQIIDVGKQAREHLIRANARLVISIARKYINHGLPFLDLIQEGNVGLMRAVRNYDYQRGFRFSTYATWWIRQAISRALAEQSRTIRLPVHMSDQINRLMRTQSQLQQTLGRPPTVDELSTSLELSPVKVQQILDTVKQPLSLQSPIGDDEEEDLGSIIEDENAPDPEDMVVQLSSNEDLRKKLESLPPRELQVLQLRYGLNGEEPLTLSDAGQRLGITRERVRQLEMQALHRLRSPGEERRKFRKRTSR